MSDILRRAHLVDREVFDPENPEHIASLCSFLKTGNWGAVQFWPELPYVEVPMTVLTKFVCHQLDVTPETPEQRLERLSKLNLVKAPPSPTREEYAAALARSNALLADALSKAA